MRPDALTRRHVLGGSLAALAVAAVPGVAVAGVSPVRGLSPADAFASAGGEWSGPVSCCWEREGAVASAFFCELLVERFGLDPMFVRYNVAPFYNEESAKWGADIRMLGVGLPLNQDFLRLPDEPRIELRARADHRSAFQPRRLGLTLLCGHWERWGASADHCRSVADLVSLARSVHAAFDARWQESE